MRVMLIVKATEDTENNVPPTPEAFAAMDRFTEELVAAGRPVAAAGLKTTPRPSASCSMVSTAHH